MKSKRNLTRFTYETAAFEGWRLCVSYKGKTFVRYFPDKKFGSGRKSLKAAEVALRQVRTMLESSRLVNNKLTATSIREIEKFLAKQA